MFDHAPAGSLRLDNARIVTAEAVIEGALVVEDGVIAEIASGAPPAVDAAADVGGDWIIPGIVDLHTDHAETHVSPRTGVTWSMLEALTAHDAVVLAAGTTTVFDSLSVGAAVHRPDRRETLGPLIDALELGIGQDVFRARHLLHLRCEITDPTARTLVDENIGRRAVRLVSVMDHTPGDRQSLDVEAWIRHTGIDMGLDRAEVLDLLEGLRDRSRRLGPELRAHVVALAAARGLSVMSHDDRTPAHVEQSAAEGMPIVEFPTTLEAAAAARRLGRSVVMGAPNYLLGGSQSGNVAVGDVLAADLVDALASDYVPRSLIDAAFAIAEDDGLPHDLPRAVALVTAAPARLAGLDGLGSIAPGNRADLVRVGRRRGHNHVAGVWRDGRRVF